MNILIGLKTIVGAVIESVKNLRDVIILTMFSLSVFALMGLQIYMGVLTQKCIRIFPMDGSWGNLTHENWDRFNKNSSKYPGDRRSCWHGFTNVAPSKCGPVIIDYIFIFSANWYVDKFDNMPLCGNSSGAGQCIEGYMCLQGYGLNPNYGYTSFDTFGWAFLSAFRLMTQDYWENLYQLVWPSS